MKIERIDLIYQNSSPFTLIIMKHQGRSLSTSYNIKEIFLYSTYKKNSQQFDFSIIISFLEGMIFQIAYLSQKVQNLQQKNYKMTLLFNFASRVVFIVLLELFFLFW